MKQITDWAQRNRDRLILWGFPLTGLCCLIAYPILRDHRLIAQGGKVIIKVSIFTPALFICLFIIGYGYQKLVMDRYLSDKPRIVYYASLLPLLAGLSAFLEALGYDMRFWP